MCVYIAHAWVSADPSARKTESHQGCRSRRLTCRSPGFLAGGDLRQYMRGAYRKLMIAMPYNIHLKPNFWTRVPDSAGPGERRKRGLGDFLCIYFRVNFWHPIDPYLELVTTRILLLYSQSPGIHNSKGALSMSYITVCLHKHWRKKITQCISLH